MSNSHFILTLNARPLDLALYDFHFNKGSQKAVVRALKAYQNKDGGFGKGIEPDFQMPDSSVLGTTLAFQYLNKVESPEDTELVRKGMHYFIQSYDHQNNGWNIVPKEVDNYPHAPWWDYKAAMAGFGWGNPATEILGYLLQHRTIVQDDALPDMLTNGALQRLHELTELDKPDFHEFLCYVRLYQHADHELQTQIYGKLAGLIKKVASINPNEWSSYGATPLTFVKSPDSPFAALFDEEIVRANLDHLKQSIVYGDHWEPTWNWEDTYPEAWIQAKQAWSGKLTVETMMVLGAFGGEQNMTIDQAIQELEELQREMNYFSKFGYDFLENSPTLETSKRILQSMYPEAHVNDVQINQVSVSEFWQEVDQGITAGREVGGDPALNEEEQAKLARLQKEYHAFFETFIQEDTCIYGYPYAYPNNVGVPIYDIFWWYAFLVINKDGKSLFLYGSATD